MGKNVAAEMAKDAVKTATDMATGLAKDIAQTVSKTMSSSRPKTDTDKSVSRAKPETEGGKRLRPRLSADLQPNQRLPKRKRARARRAA